MKKINLNSHVRSEIVRRIMEDWRKQNPRIEINALASAEQLKEREALKRKESEYRYYLALALGTFKTVAELIDEWPEMESYVPKMLINPREHIILPDLPNG